MFLSLTAQETYVEETNFAAWKRENVFASGQKHFYLILDTDFASETYVPKLSDHEINVD